MNKAIKIYEQLDELVDKSASIITKPLNDVPQLCGIYKIEVYMFSFLDYTSLV